MTPHIIDFRSCFKPVAGQSVSESFAATMRYQLDPIRSDPSVYDILPQDIIQEVFHNPSLSSYSRSKDLFTYIDGSSNLNLKKALLLCIHSIPAARHILSDDWHEFGTVISSGESNAQIHTPIENVQQAVLISIGAQHHILSIDGGGYRGIAALHMLRHLLQQVKSSENGNRKYYPHKHFDLICGTSTGGLIALMLGRLGMDVDAAINKYRELGPKVFGEDEGVFKGTILRGRRFNTLPFKTALKSWLGSEELRVEDGELNDLCRCFVTTVPGDFLSVGEPTLLRSYRSPSTVPQTPPPDYCWLVSDAALATSAALSYFEPFSLPTSHTSYTFKDAGAFGFNNPTVIAINETKRIEAFKDRDIGCVISLGTGMAPQSQFEQLTDLNGNGSTPSFIKSLTSPRDAMRHFNALKATLINVATNTESVHTSVCHQLALGENYFRFNPPTELGNIGLANFERGRYMEVITAAYLSSPDTAASFVKCVKCIEGIEAI